MIADEAAFSGLIDRIAQDPSILLDTEADSLHCYYEKLCLIQIGAAGHFFLLDPFVKEIELPRLFEALRDKEVIFHGADYDLRLMSRYGDFNPREIFDTMLAAKIAGWKELGFGALVERCFGVTLCKASQKANWALRPLPEKMVDYALNDVRYLAPLAEILKEEIEELGRKEWLRETIDRMVQTAQTPREKDDANRWRITGSAPLPPRTQAVLRALWLWRDSESREWDRPPFHVMSNDSLLSNAAAAARGEKIHVPKVSGARLARFNAALEGALQLPESEWPFTEKIRRPRPTRAELDRFDELKKLRDQIAADLKLDPSVIAPKAALEAVAADEGTDSLMNWQRGLLGLSHAGA